MVNLKSSVSFFIGDDGYSKEKTIKDLTSSLFDPSSIKLDYKIFHGDDAEISEILGYAATPPFLAKNRLVVIKDFNAMPQEDASRLIEYIKKPSKTTYLILEADDDSGIKMHGFVGKYADIYNFPRPEGAELAARIRKFFAARNKRIDNDAVLALKELCSQGSALVLAQELEKLDAFAADKSEIKVSDVEEVVGEPVTAQVSELTSAIGEKKAGDALKAIFRLVLAGKRHYEIIGLLCWHFKRALKAKMLREKGTSVPDIAEILRIGRRYQESFFRQLDALEVSQIRTKMKILLQADLDIKKTRYNPGNVLEIAVIKLCLG